jgi:TonB family protein
MVGGRSALYLHIKYPLKARKEGIQGRLLLGFRVNEDGQAEDIRVLRSLHPLCDSAAVRALRSVEFAPARRAGTPVAMRTTLPVRFRLVADSARTRTADARPNRPHP